MFDLGALEQAIAAHGRVARVVITSVEGSSPREVGAAMLVWDGDASGTIGGGALEWEALARARHMLRATPPSPLPDPQGGWDERGGRALADDEGRLPAPPVGEKWGGVAVRVDRVPLGPNLGQCCGGAVTLWTEVHVAVPVAEAGVVVRGPGQMPLAVKRLLATARGQGTRPAPGLVAGWLVEPVAEPTREVWVWGAGHVGRALVGVLAPLPGVAVTWVDVAPERFPDQVPDEVRVLPTAQPVQAVALAPVMAEHVILTYSHALDLELCHQILTRGFRSCGLIGSATKRARFRARLAALGHSVESIGRIDCPIGDPSLGKHPQAIAVGVAAGFLRGAVIPRQEMRA